MRSSWSNRLLFFLVLVLFGGSKANAQPSQPDSLTVLSYNIHGLLVDGPSRDWDPQRARRLLDEIDSLDADLVGFQEVLQTLLGGSQDNQLKTLADSLSARRGVPYHYRFAITHIGWNRYNEGVGILSRYPIIEADAITYSARGLFARKLLRARADTPVGHVNFYVTHLAHRAEDASDRLEQVREAMRRIAALETDSVRASVFVGDFNAVPTAASIRELTTPDSAGTVFVDAYSTAVPSSPGYTTPANSPNRRIDYVFVRGVETLVPVSGDVVFKNVVDGKLLSDHLGVKAVLRAPTATGRLVADKPEMPILLSNYPNPFRSGTRVTYSVPSTSRVTLTVYNILGIQIDQLVDRVHTEGTYDVAFDGTGLANGLYLYRLTTPQGSLTRMMTLAR